ncbi:TetR/AcrR family transcriptional regulator [Holophaga foetida]|uniref:TetR/AcrR family transcriptional regulator n=1 Tax=Holophaga foetida TaxID=35839 RepID=UPI0002474999|nr:TetR/AcrR family transcriptional regulator [Holophaga foetida]
MSTRAKKSPPRARDAEATRALILEAVGRLLVREGFGALGVNAVAREAGVDKVLIYRYFGGMDALLEAWGEDPNFWPTVAETLGEEPEQDAANLASGMLKRHIQALRKRPQTLEVLAWEATTRHPLTSILARIRETRSEELMAALPTGMFSPEVDLPALSAIIGAGLQHLLLRSRTVNVFSGIPISSPEGWQRLEATLDVLCERIFPVEPRTHRGAK